jgi:basic membrane protein A and related proteins
MRKASLTKTLIRIVVKASCLLCLFACEKASVGPNQLSTGHTKVAVVMSGPVSDRGWNADGLKGAQLIKQVLGWDFAFSENISQADQANVLRQYAQNGYGLIFAHSYEWGDAVSAAAPDFPNVRFVQINDTVVGSGVAPSNLSGVNFVYGELGYFTGMAAALMSRRGKIGVVAAHEAPQVTADVRTFKEGAVAANPKANVSVAYVGSWDDIVKGQQVAQAQMERGADVLAIIGNAFVPVVVRQAKEKGIQVIAGWPTDMYDLDPDAIITSAVQDVPRVYLNMAEMLKEDKLLGNHVYVFGFKDSGQRLGKWGNKVPPEVRRVVNQAIEDYKAGKLQIPLLK